MDDLERRIDRLESRQALSDLAASYCSTVDAKDVVALVALFTTDASFNDLRGSAAIGSFFGTWMAEQGPSFHFPHSHVIVFRSDDEASGLVTGHAEQRKGDEVWVMGVQYSDRYRREAGRWLFTSRTVGYRYRVRAEDYARRFAEIDR